MILRTIAAALLALSALAAPLPAQVESKAEMSPLFPQRGDIPKSFKADRSGFDYVRRVAEIPMRDGKKMHTVIIVPRGVARAPIMLDRTPYSADGSTKSRGGGTVIEDILRPAYAELARDGYIIAFQDVRGKYGSEGDYVMTRPVRGPLNPTRVDHATDAYDTIAWLVKHVPESNGRVGTIGTSYDGFTTLMSLVNPHPALKAAVPINPMVDGWKGDDWFHNGAFRQEMLSYIYGQTATKASDEDWFSAAYDDYTTFLRYGSAGAYARAMGMDALPFWRRVAEHPDYDQYWQGQALDRIIAGQGLTVPTLFVHSMWDQEDIYGAPAMFRALKGRDNGNAHLGIGPWHHGEVNVAGNKLGALEFDGDTAKWFRTNVMRPFLDAHLKDNAPAATIAKVTAYETVHASSETKSVFL
jgi:putative CocE/NonD family hydrolase